MSARRDVQETDFRTIYTVQGTGSTYTYYDQSCDPGRYYEYRVEAFTDCDGQLTCSNYKTGIGFAQNYGTISGQVLYGSGDAVDSVRVSLTPNSSTENQNSFFYATQFTDKSYGIQVPIGGENGLSENVLNGDYTIGMWVKQNVKQHCRLFTILKENGKYMGLNTGQYRMIMDGNMGYTAGEIEKTLKKDSWNFVFIKREKGTAEGSLSGYFTVGFIDEDRKLYTNE